MRISAENCFACYEGTAFAEGAIDVKNKLCILSFFTRGGTLVQHRSLQSGNLLASFSRWICAAARRNGGLI